MVESTDDELTNTTCNILYILSLDIKITSKGVKNVSSLNDENIRVLNTDYHNGYSRTSIYKYLTFDDKPLPEELVDYVKKNTFFGKIN